MNIGHRTSNIGFRTGVAALGLILGSSLGFAATDGGTATAQFLRLGQGARPQGMGGAFTAVADDISASYWNPAGLATLKKQEATFSHLQFIQDIKSEYAAYAYPLKKMKGTLSASINYLNLGKVERRDDTGALVGGDLSLTGMAITAGYSQQVMPTVFLGGNVKMIQQDLDVASGSGMAFDAGILVVVIPDKLSLGAAVANMGPKLKTGTVAEDLPTTMRGGAALKLIPNKLLVALDVEQPTDSDTKIRAGAEFYVTPMLALRGGYEQQSDAGSGLTVGVGLQMNKVGENEDEGSFGSPRKGVSAWQNESLPWNLNTSLDYAFVSLSEFENVHRISISFKF